MTRYLIAKKQLQSALQKHDTAEEKSSEILFSVYRQEMESVIDLILEIKERQPLPPKPKST